MKGILRKADIVLAFFLVLMCGAACVFAYGAGESGNTAVIRIDGKIYGTYDLSEEREIDIHSVFGHNRLVIENGKIRMVEADCPDGYCKDQYASLGGIDSSEQMIVCLPHRLVVTVSNEENRDEKDVPDAVSGQVYTSDGGDGDD
ncbi:MAG: NusG domain II-containing protein [Clostridia bacterium]|nr:NusG domain II-containing protein [Clostridia bacterium]